MVEPSSPKATPKKQKKKTGDRKNLGKSPEKKSLSKKPASPAPSKTSKAKSSSSVQKKSPPPVYTDMARFAQYMADMNVRTQDIMRDVTERQAEKGLQGISQPTDPLNVSEAGTEVMSALSQNPLKLMELQMSLWDSYARLYSSSVEKMSGKDVEPLVTPKPGDRRFRHKAWEENPMLDFIKQSYFLFSEWVDKAIEEADGVDEATKRRAYFHADQFLAAMSPSNVPTLNPDVIDETISSQGTNWLA
ncbi:MAG: class I poly(R)-hydroxyalkanoic acid synthase, partial [Pseudomonadota bacterium]